MSIYLEGIRVVLRNFPIIVIFLSIPILILFYRKSGGLVFWQSIMTYSFIFYILCCFALVVYPLPDVETVARLKTPTMQLIPFTFVKDFIAHTSLVLADPSTYLGALKQSYVYQPLFNIIMTLPFGFYMRYMFKQSLLQTIIWTFLLSLTFEVTQLTGNFGMYPRAYRLFDVDDLMMNTVGGLVGYLVSKPLIHFLPNDLQLQSWERKRNQYVTFTRRFVALMIDYFIIYLNVIILSIITISVFQAPQWGSIVVGFSMVFLYYILLPFFWNGQTIGKKVVRIHLTMDTGAPIRFWNIAIRNGLFHFIYPTFFTISQKYIADCIQSSTVSLQILGVVWIVLLFIVPLFSLIYASFAGHKRLLYEKLSHTRETSRVFIN